jgi:hypothetical protein
MPYASNVINVDVPAASFYPGWSKSKYLINSSICSADSLRRV